jgi:hypothetical protein
MDYNKFRLFEFKLKNMVEDPSICMIAKRGSGKSWITRDVCYRYRHHPCGAVISPTDRMNPFYREFFADLFIHYEISPVLLEKFLTRQKKMQDKKARKAKMGLKVDPSAIIVMDDCLAQKGKWEKDETTREILMNGRHYKITYILTMQTPLGIDPQLRFNFDYIFLLKEDSAINIRKLWINYASMFPTQGIFERVFAACTDDFKAMVVDNRKPSNKIHEKVFWFKAKDRRFSFGSHQFRQMHKKYYDPSYAIKKSAATQDIGRLFGSRKKNDINLKIEMVK